MHGASRLPPWTKLAETANAGNFTLVLQDVTDWEAADRVLNLTGRPAFWSSGVQPTFVHLDGLHPTAEKAREVFMPIQQYVNVLPWLLP
jgi:hypothetical protein